MQLYSKLVWQMLYIGRKDEKKHIFVTPKRLELGQYNRLYIKVE